MILADYFRSEKTLEWDIAKQCGVEHGVIRLPETKDFDVTSLSHWQTVHKNFTDFGIKPIIIEPMPNELHDHIKSGDEKRDECIEKAIKMLPIMDKLDIRTICFNFMAHIGWLRTSSKIEERGGAFVTGFNINDFKPIEAAITKEQLWANYEYFIKAIMPYADKYNIKLALHPDDPPIDNLGNVARIMTSYENINKAVNMYKSDNLGVTMCQATYLMMGEDLEHVIKELKDKIFFVHFRNARGNKLKFNETFHDNGKIEMAKLLKYYHSLGIDVPIRVDHVPAMAGDSDTSGYGNIGRLFAIGYLKGILEAVEGRKK